MKIAIIGCGYIGTELAKFWIKKEKKYLITATVNHSKKWASLDRLVHKSLMMKGDDQSQLEMLLKENDVLVLSVSTQSLDNYQDTYLNTAQTLRKAALKVKAPKTLIYTSHAMIYGDHQGHWVDELSPLNPMTDQAQILIETENTLLSLQKQKWNVTILRLGEIYGPGREISKIVKNLEKHILPGEGEHYTNMIHQEDVVSAIDYVLHYKLDGIYNLVDDDHMTRKKLYDEICERLNLTKVTWDPSHSKIDNGNRRVSNHKIKAAGYSLLHPHRVFS